MSLSQPARTDAHAIDRAIDLASRLVREQEQRVTRFAASSAERQAAETLLDTLRASLALGYRCRFLSGRIQAAGGVASTQAAMHAPPQAGAPADRADDARAAREAERKRIAQELHDELGQQLNALGLSVQRVDRLTGADNRSHPLAVAIQDLQAQVECSLASVKRLTQQLRPSALDKLGFPAAVEWMAAEFANRANIRLACRLRANDLDVSEAAAAALFRIVQEALTNVARHARARSVTIDLFRDGDACVLRIADDGAGTTFGYPHSKQSMGLSGMADRVAQFQGTLSIRSTEGAGFTIVARLPVAAIAPHHH